MNRQRRFVAVAIAAAAATGLLAGCGTGAGGDTAGGKVDLSYWLWDASQQPGYEQCAAAFEDANPDISVTVKQYAWGDYWSQITTGLVSNTAPDVFVGHASYFPTFVEKNQILPIDDVVASEGIDLDQYQAGLADAWVGSDGKRYGLPKDIGLAAMYGNGEKIAEGGYDIADLQDLEWNPEDGGTFEKVIAHLSVDENGVRGDEDGFDKTKVATYGLGLNGDGGGLGETIWGQYAISNGWESYSEKDGTIHFNYDDPKFLEAISWFKGLSEKGYMPTLQAATSGVGQQDSFGAGKYALISEGSWSAKSLFGYDGITTELFPLPVGPDGHRASPATGLGDNIAVTTKHPEEAKKLVAFFGTEACQDLIAKDGVVFPAIASLQDETKATYADNGIDISAFYVPLDDGDTYAAPAVAEWAELDAIMAPAMQAYLNGSAPLDSFSKVNEQVNAIFAR